MVALTQPPAPSKTYKATVVGRRGKAPMTITATFEAQDVKHAKRVFLDTVLGGKITYEEVTKPEQDPKAESAPQGRKRARE